MIIFSPFVRFRNLSFLGSIDNDILFIESTKRFVALFRDRSGTDTILHHCKHLKLIRVLTCMLNQELSLLIGA